MIWDLVVELQGDEGSCEDLGVAFLLLGTISIIYNKRSADRFAEFQKGWGLEGHTAVVVGRLISILGGLMFVVVGYYV